MHYLTKEIAFINTYTIYLVLPRLSIVNSHHVAMLSLKCLEYVFLRGCESLNNVVITCDASFCIFL